MGRHVETIEWTVQHNSALLAPLFKTHVPRTALVLTDDVRRRLRPDPRDDDARDGRYGRHGRHGRRLRRIRQRLRRKARRTGRYEQPLVHHAGVPPLAGDRPPSRQAPGHVGRHGRVRGAPLRASQPPDGNILRRDVPQRGSDRGGRAALQGTDLVPLLRRRDAPRVQPLLVPVERCQLGDQDGQREVRQAPPRPTRLHQHHRGRRHVRHGRSPRDARVVQKQLRHGQQRGELRPQDDPVRGRGFKLVVTGRDDAEQVGELGGARADVPHVSAHRRTHRTRLRHPRRAGVPSQADHPTNARAGEHVVIRIR